MKKFLSVIAALFICALTVLPAFAVGRDYVFDVTGVSIDEESLEALNESAGKISAEYGIELFYFVTDDMGTSATPEMFARTMFAEKADEGKEGACFVYFVKGNNATFYNTGETAEIFNDEVKQKIFEIFDTSGTYAEAASEHYKYLDTLLSEKTAALTELKTAQADGAEKKTEKQEIPTEQLLPYMVDNAGVLSPQQRNELNKKLKDYSEQCKCDIAIVVVPSTDGKDLYEFTMDFYDYNGFGYGNGEDGLMLLLSMEERDWCVTRCGKARKIFTENVTNQMVNEVSEELGRNDFYNAFDKFSDLYLNKYKSHRWSFLIWVPIDFGIAFAIAYGVAKGKSSANNSVKAQVNARSYIMPQSLNMAVTNNELLYRNVSRVPIIRDTTPKSGGGGGTFVSSAGHTHSVSSGKF